MTDEEWKNRINPKYAKDYYGNRIYVGDDVRIISNRFACYGMLKGSVYRVEEVWYGNTITIKRWTLPAFLFEVDSLRVVDDVKFY